MEYFINHLPYIIVAAFGIALVTVIWAFLRAASDKSLRDEEENIKRPEMCEGCALFGMCNAADPDNCDEPDRK